MSYLNLHLRQVTQNISLVLMHPVTHSPLFYTDSIFFFQTIIITFLGPWTRSFCQMMLADCFVQIWMSELSAYSSLNAHCRDQEVVQGKNSKYFVVTSVPPHLVPLNYPWAESLQLFYPAPKTNYVPEQLLRTHRAVRQVQIRVHTVWSSGRRNGSQVVSATRPSLDLVKDYITLISHQLWEESGTDQWQISICPQCSLLGFGLASSCQTFWTTYLPGILQS